MEMTRQERNLKLFTWWISPTASIALALSSPLAMDSSVAKTESKVLHMTWITFYSQQEPGSGSGHDSGYILHEEPALWCTAELQSNMHSWLKLHHI